MKRGHLMEIKTKIIEELAGQPITQITLINDHRVEINILTLGATWQSFLVPQAEGSKKNLILGFDKASTYLSDPLCAGQTIGRVAGRINKGQFTLDGKSVQVPQNERGNCLHGGSKGFHKQVWDYELEKSADSLSVVLTYTAKETEDGFPGDMTARATYQLDNDNRVTITYEGFDASQKTLFNPTNHVYFNLSNRQDLTTHQLILKSQCYLETRDDLIPTGRFLEVDQTAYDFRAGQNLGSAISKTGGLDDAFLVEASLSTPVGHLKDMTSGDQVSFYSDRNAWVAYTMGGIPDTIHPSRDHGSAAKEFEAIALEAQFLPDAINHDHFGDITLNPDDHKSYTIIFEYSRDSQ